MKPLSICGASELYDNASQCIIVRHWVDHIGLAKLSRLLRVLVRSLGDEAADDFWRRTLGPIRRTSFALCSTPLPFANVASATGIEWDRLDRLVRQSQQLYPDSFELLEQVAAGLKQLLLETNSPLIAPIEALLQQHGALAVVLRDPRLNRAVADFFAGNNTLRRARVVSVSQLRGPYHCNALVTIGPCGWFSEYVFTAPRATAIHVVSYRWIRDGWKPGPLFLHKTDGMPDGRRTHRIGAMPRISAEMAGNGSVPENLHPADLLPPLPVFARNGSPYGTSSPGDTDDTFPARLCYLSGSRAVFVAADDGASALIIDASEIGHGVVRRVPVDQLEQGMYLLLRTSGGGDFIAPLADRILGALSGKRRAEQVEWKERLTRSAVERFGSVSRRKLSSLVCSELQSQGLAAARPVNVHYWMSSKCIRPRKREDFAAILKFAGLEDRTEQLWSAMGEIDRSHRLAGQHIRRMLLQKIGESSLESLERDGEMEFQLGDQGGSLSAYEITAVLIQEYEVPASRIGVLLDSEE